MVLNQLKGRLKTARRGHKLLKDKRDELMRQFMDIIKRNKELRTKVEDGRLISIPDLPDAIRQMIAYNFIAFAFNISSPWN